jgi:ribulose 1,5-bisphosphate carboxylase large subunit-like protein
MYAVLYAVLYEHFPADLVCMYEPPKGVLVQTKQTSARVRPLVVRLLGPFVGRNPHEKDLSNRRFATRGFFRPGGSP